MTEDNEPVDKNIQTILKDDSMTVIQLFNEFEQDDLFLNFLDDFSQHTTERHSLKRFQDSSPKRLDLDEYPIHSHSIRHTELINTINTDILSAETNYIANTINACPDIIHLLNDINHFDLFLEKTENALIHMHQNVSQIATDIQTLQEESDKRQHTLNKKKHLKDVLSLYINQIIVTPELIHVICNGTINSIYLQQVLLLEKKWERAKQPGMRIHPSAKESLFELDKLRMKAIERIRDYLINKIDNLKHPQTNIQVLHQELLKKEKKIFHFLQEHHVQSSQLIKKHYILTMNLAYLFKFRSYIHALSQLHLHDSYSHSPLLGDPISTAASTQSSARGAVNALLGLSRPSDHLNKRNIFSLGNRETILDHLQDVPILSTQLNTMSDDTTQQRVVGHYPLLDNQHHSVSTTIPSSMSEQNSSNGSVSTSTKYYPEALFRSHQKLFLDVSTAEYLFLLDFFFNQPVTINNENLKISDPINENTDANDSTHCSTKNIKYIKKMFTDIFNKTCHYIIQYLQQLVSASSDCIGLFLMIIINDFNRILIHKRQMVSLQIYIDDIQLSLWPRFQYVFEQHISSIRKISSHDLIHKMSTAQYMHPHFITRRFAEFSSALMILDQEAKRAGVRSMHAIETSLTSLQSAVEELIQMMSMDIFHLQHAAAITSTDMPHLHKTIFLINNYDFILSLYTKHHLCSIHVTRFQSLLQSQISRYVEIQLHMKFHELAEFVETTEKKNELNNESPVQTIQSIPTVSFIEEADWILQLEHVGKQFTNGWSNLVKELHNDALTSFTNFSTGMEILKQILTQLLLTYTQYQRFVMRAFPSQIERQAIPWIRQLVCTEFILAEIKTYSKPF